MRQQHHKFVATVAEGIVDQAQVCLDMKAEFREQFAADEMPVSIVDLLEMIEVDEDDAELIAEALRAVDLGFERLVKVTRVVEAGAVVGDGEFLNALDRARLRQANRLVKDLDRLLAPNDIMTLEAVDILASRVFEKALLRQEV